MASYTPNLCCMQCGSSFGSLNIHLSPCSHLLCTSHPPSESEAISIRNATMQAIEDQERLRCEIAQLQATLDPLCDQKDTVDAFIIEHDALLAPAHRTLPEILSEIFQWCVDDDMLTGARDTPIVLSQICSYLRSCAISSPSLWSPLRVSNCHGCTIYSVAGGHRTSQIR